jgi:RNA polymerase sigma-70 factor (ECF subfamily)
MFARRGGKVHVRADDSDIHAFPHTQWTLVGLVGQTTSDGQREALGELLRRYLPALRTFLVLDRRLTPEKAADVLQGFVAGKLLEQKVLKRSDRSRGKFRTFLLAALRNYLIDQERYERAARRRPAEEIADVDEQFDVSSEEIEPSAAFDAAWARQVIGDAVELMRSECQAGRRADVWGVFEHRVLKPTLEDATPLEYDELVAQLGLQSPQHASNVLITGKRMFARALRAVVSQYAEPEAVEEELAELKAVLARS